MLATPRPTPLTDKTLVLDMDETLLYAYLVEEAEESPLEKIECFYSDDSCFDIRTRSFRVPFYDPVEIKGTGVKYDCWGVTRPHLEEFLTFCFEYFQYVVVWSAGRDTYVNRLTDEITRDTHPFDLVWSYHDCSEKGMSKPLTKLLKAHPKLGSIEKIFIVDDKLSSIKKNIKNGIIIPAYEPEISIEGLRKDDDALLRLKKWFLLPEVIASQDVRLLKKNIF